MAPVGRILPKWQVVVTDLTVTIVASTVKIVKAQKSELAKPFRITNFDSLLWSP